MLNLLIAIICVTYEDICEILEEVFYFITIII